MSQIEVNGHYLQVEQAGPPDGLPVILLHHGLGAIPSWKQQMPALAAAGYSVIAYDRWGYGGSDPRPALDVPFFQQDLADLAALIKQMDLVRPILVGHSDGGTIALYMAACCQERAAGLALIAAHIYIEAKMLPGILAVQQAYMEDARFREGLRRLHGDKTDAVFHNWFTGWRQEDHLAWDMRPLLARISCPVWVAQGEADEHATPQHAHDLAGAIPQARLWLAPGAGHMLPQEQAEMFNVQLLNFLSGFNQPGATAPALADCEERKANVQ